MSSVLTIPYEAIKYKSAHLFFTTCYFIKYKMPVKTCGIALQLATRKRTVNLVVDQLFGWMLLKYTFSVEHTHTWTLTPTLTLALFAFSRFSESNTSIGNTFIYLFVFLFASLSSSFNLLRLSLFLLFSFLSHSVLFYWMPDKVRSDIRISLKKSSLHETFFLLLLNQQAFMFRLGFSFHRMLFTCFTFILKQIQHKALKQWNEK